MKTTDPTACDEVTRRLAPWAILLAFALPLIPAAPLARAAGDEVAIDEQAAVRVPLVIPDKARKQRNPFEPTPESLARGKRLFSSQCTMCHGSTGAGDGDLAQRFEIPLPDFSKRSNRTDGELFYILTNGHGKMPAEGERLPAEWRWDMINFVRVLAD